MKTMKTTSRRCTHLATFAILIFTFLTFAAARSVSATIPNPTDQDISDAIEDEYGRDAAVPVNEINIVTLDGIVTLRGTVENILAKERATRIAETVRGVRSVVNQILVVPPSARPDAKIRRDIRNALLLDPATENFKVNVEVQDGVVTLSGRMDSWPEWNLAELIAKRVKGVTEVRNQMTVVPKKKRSDHQIEGEIRQKLRWDAMVDDGSIKVDVRKAVVHLRGTVGSAAEKRIAITDSWISGVQSVDASGLKVAGWKRSNDLRKDKYVYKSDEEIKKAVEDAFLFDPRVNPFRVKVDVSSTEVTLRGEVNNLLAVHAAAQDARNTVGVSMVHNRLRVNPKTKIDDEQIETNILEAIDRSPFTELQKIQVDVRNGVVRLDGAVNTQFLKIKSEQIASRVKGVVDVRNRIDVKSFGEIYSYKPYVDPYDPYNLPWYDRAPQFTTYRTKSDRKIRDQIRDELWWSPFVSEDDVEVSVDEGVATLKGTVSSWLEYRSAAENALEGGAYRVKNELVVRTPSSEN